MTITRDFDLYGSYIQGRNFADFRDLATTRNFSSLFNKGSFLGSISLQGSIILESQPPNEISRRSFVGGNSVTSGGCLLFLCGGVTTVPTNNGSRQSLNFGFSPSPAPSVSVNFAGTSRKPLVNFGCVLSNSSSNQRKCGE